MNFDRLRFVAERAEAAVIANFAAGVEVAKLGAATGGTAGALAR